MIIALPMSRGRLASHFTKAQRIGFFNQYHQLLTSFDNPALAGGCSAKKAMLDLIKAQQTDIVIVQHVGERMLGKLLTAGVCVSKGDSQDSIETLLTASLDLNHRLLDASEGRASLNHEKKGGCCSGATGGCGCGTKKSISPNMHKSALVAPPQTKLETSDIGKLHYSGFSIGE